MNHQSQWRQITSLITGNPSGTKCDTCREIGMLHCTEAFYGCDGMRDYTFDELKEALYELFDRKEV